MPQIGGQTTRSFMEQVKQDKCVVLGCGCRVPVDPDSLVDLYMFLGDGAVDEFCDHVVGSHRCPERRDGG